MAESIPPLVKAALATEFAGMHRKIAGAQAELDRRIDKLSDDVGELRRELIREIRESRDVQKSLHGVELQTQENAMELRNNARRAGGALGAATALGTEAMIRLMEWLSK